MRGKGFRTGLRGASVVLVLSCAWAFAQPATKPSKGPFKLTLADVNVCLDTLSGIDKALAEPAPRAGLQAVRKVLEGARTTAGEPVKDAPIPWAFADNLAAGPYLQNVTTDSVLIRWTAVQSDATVRYGTGGDLSSTATAVRLPAPRRMHEALLTGLRAGARYTYSIRMGERDVTGTFRTAPSGDAPFILAVWGDNQRQRDWAKLTVHADVAGQMARQPIDLAISVGDIVDVGVTEGDYYREFFQPAKGLLRNVPFVAALGNHEPIADPELTLYRRLIRHGGGENNYYAFSYANCRFIVLDSNEHRMNQGVDTKERLGLHAAEQLEWLKRELTSDACRKARWRFLVLHHSPYCWDWYGGDKNVQQKIVPLAEEHNVDMVFSGHFHCYERGVRSLNGHKTWYVVTGGGGGAFTSLPGFTPGKNEWEFMSNHAWKHHFVMVKVDAGALTVRAIDDKGEVFDEFSTDGAGRVAGWPASRPGAGATPPAAIQSRPGSPPAGGLALPPEETRTCVLSAADRTAALAALKESRKALGSRHAESAYRLELVSAVLEEARDASREGTWPLPKTAQFVPRVVMDERFHFRLKPSESAGATVRAALDNVKNLGEGTFDVRGEDIDRGATFGAALHGGWRWLLVDSIVPR